MEEEFLKVPLFYTLPLPLNVNGCAKESLDKNQRSRGSAEGGGGTARGHPPSGGQQRHHGGGGGHGGSERRHCHRSQERQHLANMHSRGEQFQESILVAFYYYCCVKS